MPDFDDIDLDFKIITEKSKLAFFPIPSIKIARYFHEKRKISCNVKRWRGIY